MSDLYFAGREAALESQLKNEQVASDHLNAKLIAAQQRLAEVERERDVLKTIMKQELGEAAAERDALQRENRELKDKVASLSKGLDEDDELIAAKDRENQRLRELAEKALDRISVDDVAWARQALHHAARREGPA